MKSIVQLLRFLKPYRVWALIAPLLMMLEVAMDLMQPRMIARIVDEGIAQKNLPLVLQLGGMMIGFAIIGAFGGMSNGFFAVRAVQGFAADLRETLFRKVQELQIFLLQHELLHRQNQLLMEFALFRKHCRFHYLNKPVHRHQRNLRCR